MIREINASAVAGLPRRWRKAKALVSDEEHSGLRASSIPLETPHAVSLPLVYPPESPWVLEAVRPAL